MHVTTWLSKVFEKIHEEIVRDVGGKSVSKLDVYENEIDEKWTWIESADGESHTLYIGEQQAPLIVQESAIYEIVTGRNLTLVRRALSDSKPSNVVIVLSNRLELKPVVQSSASSGAVLPTAVSQ